MRLGLSALFALALMTGGAAAQTPQTARPSAETDAIPPVHADPLLDPLTADRLEPFASPDAFAAYARDVAAYQAARRQRINAEWQRRRQQSAVPERRRMGLVQDGGYDQVCTDPECLGQDAGDSDGGAEIVVTGSRVGGARNSAPSRAPSRTSRASNSPNITNVQTAGVDEGDIVKQIGDYLIMLQDGRLFVVDTSERQLRLTDRTDVYVHKNDGAWYDEMLVEGERIIVTAYSYGNQATEITIFRLDQTSGRLTRDGRFFLNSYDYYSGENYASRIIGDNLVLYTVYAVNHLSWANVQTRLWRWTEAGEALRGRGRPAPETTREGRPLVDPSTIYRPLLRTSDPFVHVVTVCPLGTYRPGGVPECRVQSFVGPAQREFFVSTEAIYLWVGQQQWGWDVPAAAGNKRCEASPSPANMTPALVYRVPVDGGAPGVVGLYGQPVDQFSMDMTRDTFRIFTRWTQPGCNTPGTRVGYRFTNVPLSDFTATLATVPAEQQVAVPPPGPGVIENRFADDWFVYGGRTEAWGATADPRDPGRPLMVLSVDNPAAPQRVELPHNIIRLERVGSDRIAASGYRHNGGLDLSLVQLGAQSWRTDTAYLDNRFESEGRSHAFNSLIDDDGNGMVGIPTVLRRSGAARYVWNSQGSDVSFLTVTAEGRLTDAGALAQGLKIPVDGYRCEVSCVDWYGNSRPIFTGDRIFALMATEIAEGRMVRGEIEEVGRLNLTGPVARRRVR